MEMVGIIILLVVAAVILIAPMLPVKDTDGTWTTMWNATDTESDC